MGPISSVRPPKWQSRKNGSAKPLDVATLKSKQSETLARFRKCARESNWDAINSDHFDWWMFPIDDGRLPEFNLNCEQDVRWLRSDPAWEDSYCESIEIVSRAMGWNLQQALPIPNTWQNIPYGNKDVRLAKMIRSTWLLGVEDLFNSLQKFARYIHLNIYAGRGFYYGGICLDEILDMTLPRAV